MGKKAAMITTLYHGSTMRIERPLCDVGRQNLDFGPGFYVTNNRQQAVDWAQRLRLRNSMPGLINRYLVDKEALMAHARCKVFNEYNQEWLKFIVSCRQGYDPSADYDLVEGGVANDRVIDTVRLYMQGLMSIDTALQRLALHRPNHQLCMLNQGLTDKYFVFDGTEQL